MNNKMDAAYKAWLAFVGVLATTFLIMLWWLALEAARGGHYLGIIFTGGLSLASLVGLIVYWREK